METVRGYLKYLKLLTDHGAKKKPSEIDKVIKETMYYIQEMRQRKKRKEILNRKEIQRP
jgi:hypothetical protein